MQNLGGPARVMSNMDPELLNARQIVQDRIWQIIRQRKLRQPMNERKFREIVKKLDEGLLRSAQDKDDYMNPETLESRLHNLIKRPPNQSQQFQQAVNSSSPAGMMIPTPGMSHSGNSNMMVTSSTDASMNTTRGSTGIAPMTVNTGNLVPTGALHGGSFNRSDGSISNGYQQSPASLSVGAGGNISSMGVQRMASQMIPTPGFNSSNNQSYMNLDSSNNGGGFCTVDSLMVTQSQQQQQHIGGQNSRILHSLGSQINTGIRSGMLQKSYGLPNGALNGGLGFGNSLPVVNESGTSEGYVTSTPYANSSKPLQQHFDQHQRPVMQGDSYGMSNADSFVPGNYYGAATSVGSTLNPQNLNSVSSIPVSKAISPLVNSQSNMHGAQQSVHAKPQQPDQLEKDICNIEG
ncbi:hypothetical protein ACFX1Z_024541 [Malus domestica]